MFVGNWMSSPVYAMGPGNRVSDALRIMEMRRIRRIPVLVGEEPVGIVTREDLHARLGVGEGSGRDLELPLSEVMTRPVVTVSRNDTVERAAQLMLQHDCSGLPVMDEDRVVGMITESDIFHALVHIMGGEAQGARLVTRISSRSDLSTELARRLDGLHVLSLLVWYSPPVGWDLVARVRGKTGPAPEPTTTGAEWATG